MSRGSISIKHQVNLLSTISFVYSGAPLIFHQNRSHLLHQKIFFFPKYPLGQQNLSFQPKAHCIYLGKATIWNWECDSLSEWLLEANELFYPYVKLSDTDQLTTINSSKIPFTCFALCHKAHTRWTISCGYYPLAVVRTMVHKLRTITNTKHIFQIGSTSNGFNCKILSRYIFVIKPKTSDRKTLFIPEEYRRWTTRVEDLRSNRTSSMRTRSSWPNNDRRSTNWETKSISTSCIELRLLWRKNDWKYAWFNVFQTCRDWVFDS